MASIRRVIMMSVTLVALVLIACGSEPSPPEAIVSVPAVPSTPTILISREQAIEIALTRMADGKFAMGDSSLALNPRDVTVRFMHVEDYENLGGGSGTFGGIGYGASGHVWVVQARVDGVSRISDSAGGFRPTRYAIEAVNTETGLISAAARIVDEPFFISAEFKPDVYELNFPADPSTPTNISRQEALQIIRNMYDPDSSGRGDQDFSKMEIVLVHSAEHGLLWWVFTPSELHTISIGGPPRDDGRHFLAWDTGVWEFVDPDTGDIYQGQNNGRIGPTTTSEENQALTRFAYAEGWWELWHRLKPYQGVPLPDGFAAALDRPDAPTPTPGPPTPTPDPNAPPPPTPTPVPDRATQPTPVPPSVMATASALARIPDPTAAFYFSESFATQLSDISADPHVTTILVGTALGIKNRSQTVAGEGRLEARYDWWVIEVDRDIVNPHGATHVGVWVRERFIGGSSTQLASANALEPGGKYVLFLSRRLAQPDTSTGIPVLPPEILPLPISGDEVVFDGIEYELEELIDQLKVSTAEAVRPVGAPN